MRTSRSRLFGTLAAALVATVAFCSASFAQSAADFYKGKTIRVMSTTGAGGTMDLYLLLMMKHIKKHLPAGTEVVLEHRPGAGTIVGTNHMYANAPRDGTYFGMLSPNLGLMPVSRPDVVRFKPTEFISIGRLTDLPRVFVARADAGIKTLKDATKEEITHAILSPGDTMDMMMSSVNQALGTKFRAIPGYTGGGPAFLAIEQGEVKSGSAEPGNLIVNKWHLVEKGVINVLAQYGLEPVAALKDVPMITDLVAKDHKLRPVIEAIAGSAAYGLSVTFPPDVPADRVAYIRDVFAKTLKDPELIAEAKERKIPVSYQDGPWLDKLIKQAAAQPEWVNKWLFETANPKKQ